MPPRPACSRERRSARSARRRARGTPTSRRDVHPDVPPPVLRCSLVNAAVLERDERIELRHVSEMEADWRGIPVVEPTGHEAPDAEPTPGRLGCFRCYPRCRGRDRARIADELPPALLNVCHIGPRRARRLIDALGSQGEALLDQAPERLFRTLRGIGPRQARASADAWRGRPVYGAATRDSDSPTPQAD